MALFRHALIALALVGSMTLTAPLLQAVQAEPSAAQAPQTPPPKPSGSLTERARKEWNGISTMTRQQWDRLKGRWAVEKTKWNSCKREARARKLSMAKRWTAVGKCMLR